MPTAYFGDRAQLASCQVQRMQWRFLSLKESMWVFSQTLRSLHQREKRIYKSTASMKECITIFFSLQESLQTSSSFKKIFLFQPRAAPIGSLDLHILVLIII